MHRIALTTRFVLFSVFFLAGAAAMVLSIIAEPELKEYYESRAALTKIQEQNVTIENLTDKYAAQIALIESEPNILDRFIPMTFGQKPQAPDTAFPQVQNQTLQIETDKLMERIQQAPTVEPIPTWLTRVIEPKNQRGLFLSGAGLIIITFIYFGTNKSR